MLKRLHLKNFTVFAAADFEFSPGLNVLVGTNGTGKSHVLKVGYAVIDASAKMTLIKNGQNPVWSVLPDGNDFYALANSGELQSSLYGVFHVNELAALHRADSTLNAEVQVQYSQPSGQCNFIIDTAQDDRGKLILSQYPVPENLPIFPLFIPAKEVLSFYEGFGSLYRKYNLAFDQTYLDLCEALSIPVLREPGPSMQPLLNSLERIMQGRVALEGGRFYLYPQHAKRQEINLAAEGIRKFGVLAQLLANGSLASQTTLFWDEPEANLNPALLRKLAAILAELARQGFQIILATHSMSLLKEFHILSREKEKGDLPIRYFGLNARPGHATTVVTQDNFEYLPDVVALDVELQQAEKLEEIFAREDREAHANNH